MARSMTGQFLAIPKPMERRIIPRVAPQPTSVPSQGFVLQRETMARTPFSGSMDAQMIRSGAPTAQNTV